MTKLFVEMVTRALEIHLTSTSHSTKST